MKILADENIAHVAEYFGTHGDLIVCQGRNITQETLDQHRPDALLIRSVTKLMPQTIRDFGNVGFVGTATIGTDHVDRSYLERFGIHFASAAGCSKHSVAQYVITAILHTHKTATPITLGVIGLGNIGSTLVRYAKELGWQVLGYDPFLPTSPTNNSDFNTLVAHSNVISIHTPLTTAGSHPTLGMIDHQALMRMPPHCLLINTARGKIIDEVALLRTIDTHHHRAVLDVFADEPNIDRMILDRLTLATPHIAGYTLEGKLRGTQLIYEAFCRYAGHRIAHEMTHFLPKNPLHWHDLSRHTDQLPTFYDIKKDDRLLRDVCGAKGVLGSDFDALRKHYPLRREWLYDPTSTDFDS